MLLAFPVENTRVLLSYVFSHASAVVHEPHEALDSEARRRNVEQRHLLGEDMNIRQPNIRIAPPPTKWHTIEQNRNNEVLSDSECTVHGQRAWTNGTGRKWILTLVTGRILPSTRSLERVWHLATLFSADDSKFEEIAIVYENIHVEYMYRSFRIVSGLLTGPRVRPNSTEACHSDLRSNMVGILNCLVAPALVPIRVAAVAHEAAHIIRAMLRRGACFAELTDCTFARYIYIYTSCRGAQTRQQIGIFEEEVCFGVHSYIQTGAILLTTPWSTHTCGGAGGGGNSTANRAPVHTPDRSRC